mmetsp:Transcript_4941/g.12614  ORF Transcript_4941/g.12614 Transcript_4941/m.12614 type:complete len:226 (-) Transcript_4941:262-939(-)
MHLFKKVRFCDRLRMSRTAAGGSSPKSNARSQRSYRVIPRHGPYLALMSNCLSTSPTQFMCPFGNFFPQPVQNQECQGIWYLRFIRLYALPFPLLPPPPPPPASSRPATAPSSFFSLLADSMKSASRRRRACDWPPLVLRARRGSAFWRFASGLGSSEEKATRGSSGASSGASALGLGVLGPSGAGALSTMRFLFPFPLRRRRYASCPALSLASRLHASLASRRR